MRNLKTPDLFKITKIMKKMNLKEDIAAIAQTSDMTAEQFYYTALFTIIENAGEAENELMKFLADVAEVKKEELENDEFELFGDIVEHLKNQPKLKAFLEQAFQQIQ